MAALTAHFSAASTAIERCDGVHLAGLLAVTPSHPALAGLPVGGAPVPSPAALLEALPRGAQLFPRESSWARVLAGAVCASAALAASPPDALQALGHACGALEEFGGPVEDAADGWVVAPLLRVARDAMALLPAARAAAAEDREEAFVVQQEKLMNAMRSRFSECNRGEREGGKRAACVVLTNIMCRFFFWLHTPRQARFFLNAVGKLGLDVDKCPPGVAVTYRYYEGRLSMYEDRLQEADRALGFAFEQCHAGGHALAARLKILEALLPVRLLLGWLPTPALLEAYGLSARYGGIVRGLEKGDLAAYRAGLEDGMEYFVRRGTYLLLDRLQLLVVRSLVKRLCVTTTRALAHTRAPPFFFLTRLRGTHTPRPPAHAS